VHPHVEWMRWLVMCEVGSWVEMELNNPVEQFFE